MSEHTITQTGDNHGLMQALRDCDRATPREVATETLAEWCIRQDHENGEHFGCSSRDCDRATPRSTSTVAYVVEYSDEQGNRAEHSHTGNNAHTEAAEMVLRMLAHSGIDPDSAYDPFHEVTEGSIADNLYAYLANGIPWHTAYDMGDGDNGFSVHRYSPTYGNYSISLIMIES